MINVTARIFISLSSDVRAPTSIQQKAKPPTDDTYSDFNFWKIPLPIID